MARGTWYDRTVRDFDLYGRDPYPPLYPRAPVDFVMPTDEEIASRKAAGDRIVDRLVKEYADKHGLEPRKP